MKVFIIPYDYAGHTIAYDLSKEEQARCILTDAVKEFESMGHVFNDIHEHIKALNWNEISYQLKETGLCQNRDGFILNVDNEWKTGRF
jgi:hypothetical protein